MTNTSNNQRPFAALPTSTLWSVVKRGKYARYGEQFEAALQQELQVRNLRVS